MMNMNQIDYERKQTREQHLKDKSNKFVDEKINKLQESMLVYQKVLHDSGLVPDQVYLSPSPEDDNILSIRKKTDLRNQVRINVNHLKSVIGPNSYVKDIYQKNREQHD